VPLIRSFGQTDDLELGIGTTRPKLEGRVAHPADIYTHCGCERCELRWQQQLAAYLADQGQVNG